MASREHRKTLMIPGPTEVDAAALSVMALPIRAHYGPEWVKIYNETCDMVSKVMGSKERVILHTGPGTFAMEMAVANVVEEGMPVLCCVNGFFGERFLSVLRSYGARPVKVVAPLGRAIDPDAVHRELQRNPEAKAVFLVHSETSTGVLNPLREVAAVAQRHNVLTVADAISSLGTSEIDVASWGVDICVSASQKGLGAPPGLCVLAVSPRAWDYVHQRPSKPHGWLMSLLTWKRFRERWSTWHPHPTTESTPLVLALRESVRGILSEGLPHVYDRHRRAAAAIREGALRLNLNPFVKNEEEASKAVSAIAVPPGIDAGRVRSFMGDRFNLLVGEGLEELKGKILRIGHMATTANEEFVVLALTAIATALRDQGKGGDVQAALHRVGEIFTRPRSS